MKFKHTFNVFVNNFSATYKLLLYRLIVTLISAGLYAAVLIPFISLVTDTAEYGAFSETLKKIGEAFYALDLDKISEPLRELRPAFENFLTMLSTRGGEIAGEIVGLIVVYLVQRWLSGLGNYAAGALVNDKMSLQADSSFTHAIIKNMGKACLYNVIYIPIAVAYDIISVVIVYSLLFNALTFLPLLAKVVLFSAVIVLLITLKMTFTSDWLPALIYGKNNRQAIASSFRRNGKNLLSVFSNYLIIILSIMAVNVCAALFTFGAGIFITVPASYLLIICFQFVNYCDHNKVKYFIDKNTVIRPETEHVPTREEFFRGEDN